MRLRRPPLGDSRLRALAICVLLAILAFIIGSILPVPSEGDEAREAIERQVRERLPSWEIATLSEGYEGSWVIAVRCGPERVDFRLMRDPRPAGGLSPGDYWILAGDPKSFDHLDEITDEIGGWLVWRAEPTSLEPLPCDTAATRPG